MSVSVPAAVALMALLVFCMSYWVTGPVLFSKLKKHQWMSDLSRNYALSIGYFWVPASFVCCVVILGCALAALADSPPYWLQAMTEAVIEFIKSAFSGGLLAFLLVAFFANLSGAVLAHYYVGKREISWALAGALFGWVLFLVGGVVIFVGVFLISLVVSFTH